MEVRMKIGQNRIAVQVRIKSIAITILEILAGQMSSLTI